MKFAKKYYLVNEQQYNKLTGEDGSKDIFVNPSRKIARKEHTKMEEISGDDALTDYEKVVHYSQSLHKYLNNVREAMEPSKRSTVIGDNKAVDVTAHANGAVEGEKKDLSVKDEKNSPKGAEVKDSLFSRSEILSQFKSSPSRKRVAGLLKELDDGKSLTWDEISGEVIIDGTLLEGSNIKELLKTAVGLKGADKRTREWNQFSKLLKTKNLIPQKRRAQSGRGLKINKRMLVGMKPKKLCVKWHCLKD